MIRAWLCRRITQFISNLLALSFIPSRDEISELGLDEVLIQIKNESSDRDAWRMADHGLMILHNVKPMGKQNSQSSNKSGGGLITALPIKKAL